MYQFPVYVTSLFVAFFNLIICFFKLCTKEFGLEKSEDDPPQEEFSNEFPDNKSELSGDPHSPAENPEEEFSGEDPNPTSKLGGDLLDDDPDPGSPLTAKSPNIKKKTPHKPLPDWCDSDEDLQIIDVKPSTSKEGNSCSEVSEGEESTLEATKNPFKG